MKLQGKHFGVTVPLGSAGRESTSTCWTEPPLDIGTGFLAADPTTPGWLWVTTDSSGGTYLLT